MKRTLLWMLTVTIVHVGWAQDFFNKAKVVLGARDTAAAITGFQDAVKAGQKSAESNYYLGAIAVAKGKWDDAFGYLQSSIKINDENADALKLLGDVYMYKKETQQALSQYRRASKFAPKSPEVATAYGQALLAADSVDAAIVALTWAKEFAPENASVYAALGDAYLKQKVVFSAVENYKKVLELQPDNLAVELKMARAYAKNRQYNEAVKAFDGAIALDSSSADPYLEAGKILQLAKQNRRGTPYLRKYVQLRPKSTEGWQLYAKVLFGADNFPEALKASEEALRADSTNADMWRIYLHSAVETKDFKIAALAFAGLERRNAVKPEDYAATMTMYFNLAQEDRALEFGLKAIAADSTNCDPYFNLGFIYMKKQDFARAAVMFEKKIVCDPRSLSAYINAGACYVQLKEFARAREMFMKSIQLKSDFLQGHLWLGRYYVQVDTFDLAQQRYEEVLRLIGDEISKNKSVYGEANQLLGSLYITKRQYERGIDAYRKAVNAGFENGSMHLSWGQAILQTIDVKGDPEENRKKNEDAVKHFRRSTELDPSLSQAHLWLAEGLLRLRIPGEDEANKKIKEEACVEFKKALRFDPKNADAMKGMERVGCQ
jgi:tetratricopeptide (TPR) repeat protein